MTASSEHLVLDEAGIEVARYVDLGRPGPRRLDSLVSSTDDVDHAAAIVCADLAGALVSTSDERLAAQLRVRGAELRRSYSHMVLRLDAAVINAQWDPPTLPTGVSIRRLTVEDAAAMVDIETVAYPPGHVDHTRHPDRTDADELEEMTKRLASPKRPLLPEATMAERNSGPVAAVVVQDDFLRPGLNGPWLSNVCRVPDPVLTGLGETLIRSVLVRLHRGGHSQAFLGVTAGNPARKVYERVGFTELKRGWFLALPSD